MLLRSPYNVPLPHSIGALAPFIAVRNVIPADHRVQEIVENPGTPSCFGKKNRVRKELHLMVGDRHRQCRRRHALCNEPPAFFQREVFAVTFALRRELPAFLATLPRLVGDQFDFGVDGAIDPLKQRLRGLEHDCGLAREVAGLGFLRTKGSVLTGLFLNPPDVQSQRFTANVARSAFACDRHEHADGKTQK